MRAMQQVLMDATSSPAARDIARLDAQQAAIPALLAAISAGHGIQLYLPT